MGLDITAHSNLRFSDDQDEENYDLIRIWNNSHFPDHCELEQGNWEETSETNSHSFRAGSYSGYGQFRKILAMCTLGATSVDVWANEEEYVNKPFFELINFSDCEGCIGPRVSAELYQDFVDNRERFIRNLKQEIDFTKETENPLALEPEFILDLELSDMDIEYYIEKYDDFLLAFELAKENGVVQFS